MKKLKMFVKMSIIGSLALAGIFANVNLVEAQYAVPTCNSATLNGAVSPNGAATTVWFEWGPNSTPSYSTPKQTYTNSSTFSQIINGLQENTKYFYRAMAQNSAGTVASPTISFTTSTCQVNVPPPTVSITADNSNISYGSSTTIRWTSTNATSCTTSGGSNGWAGTKQTSGSFPTGSLNYTGTYSITCSNSLASNTDSVTVVVGSQQVQNPTVNLTADQTSLPYNGSTTLRWTSTNATSCSGSGGVGGWPGAHPTNSSFSVGPLTNTVTYSITCYGSNGASASDSVTVSVGNAPVQNPTVTLTANPSSVAYNGASTISWNSSNATSCSASGGTNGWSGSKNTSGTFSGGNLTNSVTFYIACTNASGSANDSATVSVGNAPVQNPTVNLTANPSSVSYNGASTISWNSSNATSCTASGGTNGWSGSKNTSGTFTTGNLTNSTTFYITCTNSSGSVNDSATVSVGNAPVQNPTVNLTANPSSVSYNGASTISWNSTNATSCSASGGTNGWSGSKNTSGTFTTGNLTNSTTFYITCYGSNGTSANDSVVINVGNQPQNVQPTVTITADDTNIDYNESTTIRWSSNNATSCSASGGSNNWSGPKNTSGTFNTSNLTSAKTYQITCINAQGASDSDSVTVTVEADNQNSEVTVTLKADDRRIDEDDRTTIRWTSQNADRCRGSGGTNGWNGKNLNDSGSFNTGDLNRDETFRITCTNDNSGNSDSDSVAITVNENSNNNTGDRPNVDLTADRSVINSGQSTTIRWNVDDADDCSASGGTNGWSGSKNRSSGSFSTGAMYGTATFFLDCGNDEGNQNDSVTVQVVSTPVVQPPQTIYVPGPTPAPIIRNVTTYVGGGTARPLIELSIDGGDDFIYAGEGRIYQVEWKNISSQTLRKVALRVTLPESMTFESTNRGSYTSRDNTITLDIDELRPGETGDMLFSARTKSALRNNQLIVVVSSIVYTDNSKNQGEVVAYATHHANLGGSVLGANVFGSGFFLGTWLGWLILLLLLLILLYLARHLSRQMGGRRDMMLVQPHQYQTIHPPQPPQYQAMPQYQVPPQYTQPPQYQAPQYQAPQQAPQYQAPNAYQQPNQYQPPHQQ